MPQRVAPAGQLGMMLMRLGEEERAKEVLDKAFEVDPFNVRVNNSIKVLDVLAGYHTHETEHFRIKYDPEKDEALAQAMGGWLDGLPDAPQPGQAQLEQHAKENSHDTFDHIRSPFTRSEAGPACCGLSIAPRLSRSDEDLPNAG